MDIQEFRTRWSGLPHSLRRDLAHNCRDYLTPQVRERNACFLTGAVGAFAECGRIDNETAVYLRALIGCIERQSWTRTFVLNEWRAEQ